MHGPSRSRTDRVRISVLVVFRNEERYILECIQGLLGQDLDPTCYEVILVDSASVDRSRALATTALERACRADWRVIDNPQGTLAAGWNVGIRAARGEFIVRLEAHGRVEPTFLRASLEALERHREVAAVGGVLRMGAVSGWGQAIGRALRSPLGVGRSAFRVGGEQGYVDTLWQGLYRREVFDKVGLFDESLKRHQDNEFHARLRASGGKLLLIPSIRPTYFGRESLRAVARQMFENGWVWGQLLGSRRTGGMSARHVAPLIALLALLFLAALAMSFETARWVVLAAVGTYLTGVVVAAWRCATGVRLIHAVWLPLVFSVVHLAYGVGTLAGLWAEVIRAIGRPLVERSRSSAARRLGGEPSLEP